MTNLVVTALAALSLAANWTSEAPELYPLADREGRLEIAIGGCATNGAKRLLLKTPVRVEEGFDLYFKTMRPQLQSLTFRALARDAKGREYAVAVEGPYCLAKSNVFGGQFRPDIVLMSSGEWRAKAPLGAIDRENATPLGGALFPAAYPVELIGFDVRPEAKTPDPNQRLWLRDFRLSNANDRNTSFFYTFMGQPRYGEVDGDPVFSGLDVQAKAWGPRYELEWELRDTFDGRPFLQGSRVVELTKKQLAEKRPLGFVIPQETFRVREEGSYWLHLRWSANWTKAGTPQARPTLVRDWTIRYDVFKGEPSAGAREPVAEGALNAAARERLAAQAKIRAEAVGEARPFAAPPLASGEEIRAGRKSLVVFNPMIHNRAESVRWYEQMMDQMVAHGLRREIEVSLTWGMMEPLPRCYDFRMLDAILDAAQARGIGCYVTFGPLVPPEWMPSWFTQNEEGRLFGHTIYLFNGGRFNVFNHPQGRACALDFAKALCDHVKGHPALLGYFYIVEHGGDANWARWFEGYDPHTRENFRRYARWLAKRDVAALNARWGTRYGSFAEVEPPHQKAPRPEDTPARLRDWTDFKAYRVEKLQFDVAKAIRERDPYRSILVYGTPPTLGAGFFDYAKIGGVITANGGCAVPNRGYAMTALAEAGLPQRAEEISCANWKAMGETQLDVSVFNMLQGGGLMTHFKMFLPQGVDMDDAKWAERNGFANFRRFVPINEELRGAERCDDEIAGWTSSRGVDFGEWNYEMLQNAQLLVGTSVTPAWRKAKLVIASPAEKTLRQAEIDALADYVAKGGALYMNWTVGREALERPGETNVLLKALGVPEPEKAWHRDWYATASVGEDSPWWPRAEGDAARFAVRLRSAAKAAEGAGEVLMRFTNDYAKGAPALTRKAFGKGTVYVLWAGEYIPYTREREPCWASKAYLAEVAADAGARLPVRAARREVAVNLLKKGEVYYLPVMSEKGCKEPVALTLDLPPGYANAVDLVSGERRTLPLSVTLKPNQVQIWRIER